MCGQVSLHEGGTESGDVSEVVKGSLAGVFDVSLNSEMWVESNTKVGDW